MGAWSGEPFGNDTAADWAWELDDSSDWELIREALGDALAGGDFIDADVATIAIAAADVVAQAQARSMTDRAGQGDEDDEQGDQEDEDEDGDDESVVAFLDRAGDPPTDIVALALNALEAATGPTSELTELWLESGADEWTAANAKVREALGG